MSDSAPKKTLSEDEKEWSNKAELDDEDEDDTPRYLGFPWSPLRQTEQFLKLQVQIPREVWNLLAGGIAGMVAKSVVAPVDRIKILYQTSNARFQFRKLPRVALRIISEEGIQALWKGNTATMIRVFPYAGIQFMVFDGCKHYFLKHQKKTTSKRKTTGTISHYDTTATPATTASTTTTETKTVTTTTVSSDKKLLIKRYSSVSSIVGLTPLESLVAGSIAGSVSVCCTYPLDLTRAQLAVLKRNRHGVNPGFLSVLVANHTRGGILGLFRGITPTMLGILPYSGVAFAMNEQAKHAITRKFRRDPTTVERMQCGALSGLFAQTLTYPLEVTRRRMQTIGLVKGTTAQTVVVENGKNASSMAAGGMVGTMRFLFQEQGLRGFFKGVTMNWLKGPIAFSISFTTFDIVQGWVLLDEKHQRR